MTVPGESCPWKYLGECLDYVISHDFFFFASLPSNSAIWVETIPHKGVFLSDANEKLTGDIVLMQLQETERSRLDLRLLQFLPADTLLESPSPQPEEW